MLLQVVRLHENKGHSDWIEGGRGRGERGGGGEGEGGERGKRRGGEGREREWEIEIEGQ